MTDTVAEIAIATGENYAGVCRDICLPPPFELLISARRYKVMYSLSSIFGEHERNFESYLSLLKKIIILVRDVSDEGSSWSSKQNYFK